MKLGNVKVSSGQVVNNNYLIDKLFDRYTVTGLELGETKIVFYSGKAEKLIRSTDVNVQVSFY